jgi:hypothetical protein
MVDDTQPVPGSTVSVCPWCSANYSGDPDTCPSCGAALAVDPATDPALPGLTAIDAAAIVRAKTPVARSRSRLLSWISGEYPDEAPSAAEAGALALPDLDVRREMLRLELAAEVANLQAEADAMLAEAGIEGGMPEAASHAAAASTAVAEDEGAATAEGGDTGVAVDQESPGDEGRQPV